MAILIPNEPMPSCCAFCPMYEDEFFARCCILYSNGIPARYEYDSTKRPDWCELKEVADD